MSAPLDLEQTIARFEPIDLAEMDSVQLQVRMDTKFIFRESELPGLLERLRPEYRLLEVNGERGIRYRSLYFDTSDHKHFLDHHNGRIFRSKVRFREYMGSGLCFLEVKRKNGRGGTEKLRKQVDRIEERPGAEDRAFIAEAIGSTEPQQAVLWNYFTRLTLVHGARHERLTIDRAVRFTRASEDQLLEGICIAELKEERADRGSPFAALMRERAIRPNSISKYCMGMILLDLAPKRNTFKSTLLQVARLQDAA